MAGLRYNCHLSVREPGREFLYKPNCKVSTAAACEANLITTRDLTTVELLGEDYPFYCEPERESILAAIERARATFGTAVWQRGLERMRQVRELTRMESVLDEYEALLRLLARSPGRPPGRHDAPPSATSSRATATRSRSTGWSTPCAAAARGRGSWCSTTTPPATSTPAPLAELPGVWLLPVCGGRSAPTTPARSSPTSTSIGWLEAQGIAYDWLVNLSAQDYPVTPVPAIEAFLGAADADGFIRHWDVRSPASPPGRGARRRRATSTATAGCRRGRRRPCAR